MRILLKILESLRYIYNIHNMQIYKTNTPKIIQCLANFNN